MDMEQFLSKHNIDKDTFETLVEESSDYDLPTKERISRLEQQEKNVGWLVELIKKGEEENEKLKEQLIEEKEKYITKCQIDLLKTKKIDEIEKENEALKKENEKLKALPAIILKSMVSKMTEEDYARNVDMLRKLNL